MGYRWLVDWSDEPDNSNIEVNLLTGHLPLGFPAAYASRAIYLVKPEAENPVRSAYGTKFGARCLNASSETVAEKPAFRSAFKFPVVRPLLSRGSGFSPFHFVDATSISGDGCCPTDTRNRGMSPTTGWSPACSKSCRQTIRESRTHSRPGICRMSPWNFPGRWPFPKLFIPRCQTAGPNAWMSEALGTPKPW